METQNIFVRRATLADLELIVPLFDAYRQFYERAQDLALAREFLRERLERDHSVIFLALRSDGTAVGFTQLYPSFSSASARRIFILNDLFVDPGARRSGVGQQLLEAAAEFGRSAGAARLTPFDGSYQRHRPVALRSARVAARRSLPQLRFAAVVTSRRQQIFLR
jgi:GNAT superfamily N-acetyltransferase